MITLTTDIVVERPRSEVFAYFADLERSAEWASPVVERRKLGEEPVGIGTLYAAIDQFPGRRVEFTVEITDYVPDERVAARWSKPIAGGWIVTFTDTDGGTRLALEAHANPTGMFRLLAPAMSGWVEHQIKADLARLKKILEG